MTASITAAIRGSTNHTLTLSNLVTVSSATSSATGRRSSTQTILTIPAPTAFGGLTCRTGTMTLSSTNRTGLTGR